MTNTVTPAGAEAGTQEAYIDASSGTNVPTSSDAAKSGFDNLGLSEQLLKAVAESGYTTPTPIQEKGIPEVLKRRDIIGIAQTGTGKTASFTLPMIELLARGRAKARMPRSLILEPTRELAAQVAESFERYGKYNKLSMALLIGGVSFDDQEKKLDRGVDVLIATPGRLLDHFERGKLMLSQVQILVVDEADRMLDMGFIPDVERICKLIPFTRQTLFYSATMPPEIQRLTEQFLHNPVRVEVSRPATTATNITQEIVEVPSNDWAKREALRRIIREAPMKNAIVFCNRKRDVDIVAKSLAKHGFSAAPLHGDLDQSVRMKTLDAFRNDQIQLLVASDVAARGLDIPAVSHVFNFDVPYHPDDYVHRIGRTGRAGRSGHTYMLATSRDQKYVEAIEALIKQSLPRRSLDGLADAAAARPPRESNGRDRHQRGRGPRSGGDRHRRDHKPYEAPVTESRADAPTTAPDTVITPPAAREHAPREHTSREHKPREHSAKEHGQRNHAERHGRQHARPQAQEPAMPRSEPARAGERAGETERQQKQPQQQRQKEPGDDARQLPAFLLRPVKLPPETPKRTRKKADVDPGA